MANHGNSGNRYRLQRFAKAERIEPLHGRPTIRVTLACGHSYPVLDGSLNWYEEQIAKGKRTRCNDCPVDR